MESLKLEGLNWIQDKGNFILTSGEGKILELVQEKANRASFTIEGKTYLIRNEGFWNPMTIIESDKRIVLILKRNFLGSKPKIQFGTSAFYGMKITNEPLVRLSIRTTDDSEILNYKLDSNSTSHAVQSVLTIHPSTEPVYELLMLIVLGFFSFQGIAIENNSGDILVLSA